MLFRSGRQVRSNPATDIPNSLSLFPQKYGPPHDCKGEGKGRSTDLRKCIRPLCGERRLLRYVFFLINGTVMRDHCREQVASTPLGAVRSSLPSGIDLGESGESWSWGGRPLFARNADFQARLSASRAR
jgi:hypothetical protein